MNVQVWKVCVACACAVYYMVVIWLVSMVCVITRAESCECGLFDYQG